MFVLPITKPKQKEKIDRYCDCGKQLSYYNDEKKCYACQKGGKSMTELNELFAKMVLGTLCLLMFVGCRTTQGVIRADSPMPKIVTPEITDMTSPDFDASSAAFKSQWPECFGDVHRAWTGPQAEACMKKVDQTIIISNGELMTYGEYRNRL